MKTDLNCTKVTKTKANLCKLQTTEQQLNPIPIEIKVKFKKDIDTHCITIYLGKLSPSHILNIRHKIEHVNTFLRKK